ncbi:MAG TPA: hypothetical protein VMW70_17320 [Burkholderiales bacterium]|nr:hypothetical protein [Burkholderiales bacterium]
MMGRSGRAQLRRAFYMPGLLARRHNRALKSFGDRLSARGLAPTAVAGAMMRKLVHFNYVAINSGRPLDINLAILRLDLQDGI